MTQTQPLNSCLYLGKVFHQRLFPKFYQFYFPLFLFYLDLDELDLVDKQCHLFSNNRLNWFSFSQTDYLPNSSQGLQGVSLKQKVLNQLQQQGVELQPDKIFLLTQVKTAGYLFNPVSFYFCFKVGAEKPFGALVEVENTFRERKVYWVPEVVGAITLKREVLKAFYVSPFSKAEHDFAFSLKKPQNQLALTVKTYGKSEAHRSSNLDLELKARLFGLRTPLANASLYFCSFIYCFQTLRVIFAIHLHALLLFLKGLPFRQKNAFMHFQQNLSFSPASLSNSSSGVH